MSFAENGMVPLKTVFRVEGMTCPKCVARVDKVMTGFEYVQRVSIDLESGLAQVDYLPVDSGFIQSVLNKVAEIGYRIAEQSTTSVEEDATLDLVVQGMTCPKCVGRVHKLIVDCAGVSSASVDLDTKAAHVLYLASRIDVLAAVLAAINGHGYEASIASPLPLVASIIDAPLPSLIPAESSIATFSPLEELRDSAISSASRDMHRLQFSIGGMSCASCVGRVEKALARQTGVVNVSVNLATNSGSVEYDASVTHASTLLSCVHSIGYETDVLDDEALTSSAVDTSMHAVVMVTVEVPRGSKVLKGDVALALDGMTGVLEVIDSPAAALAAATSRGLKCWAFRVKFDETLVGPRDMLLVAERLSVLAVISSVGGFMRASRLAEQHQKDMLALLRDLVLCLICTIPILIIGMVIPNFGGKEAKMTIMSPLPNVPGMNLFGLLLFILCTPVEFAVGLKFHLKALETIQTLTLGMDFLVSTGTGAAYLYSAIMFVEGIIEKEPRMEVEYFEVAAVLVTVVILGKFLEMYSRGKTAAAIHELASHRAQAARLVAPSFRRGSAQFVIESAEDEEDMDYIGSRKRNGYTALVMPLSGGQQDAVNAYNDDAFNDDEMIDIALVHRGDVVRLVVGESVPADGVLIEGRVNIDESMITGESMPLSKTPGSKVFGGTMVTEGSGLVRVEECGDKSMLGKILTLVQDAQASRPAIQDIADRVASYFVPTVACVSFITFLSWIITFETGNVPREWLDDPKATSSSFAFYFALAVWVSACPCAFGLATPTAILVASGIAAKNGILIRKGAALQSSSEVKTILFDKTGTLTQGKILVLDCLYFSPTDSTELYEPNDEMKVQLLSLVFAVECRSVHPIAKGITAYCSNHMSGAVDGTSLALELSSAQSNNFESISGKGVRMTFLNDMGNIEHKIVIGSAQMLLDIGVAVPSIAMSTSIELRSSGKIVVFVAVDGEFSMLFGLGDEVRPEAAAVIRYLQSQHIACHMVTGDNELTALAIGAQLGIPEDNICSGASPKEKEDYVHMLATLSTEASKGKAKVAFVGDGTNDAPALSKAEVGFVMSSGTDLALECGDIVLCKNTLESVVIAIDLSKQTIKKIYANYFWALIYNCFLVPIAAGVLIIPFNFKLNPMIAGGAMAGSSVSVVLSSLMLRMYKPPVLEPVQVVGSRVKYNSLPSTDDLDV